MKQKMVLDEGSRFLSKKRKSNFLGFTHFQSAVDFFGEFHIIQKNCE